MKRAFIRAVVLTLASASAARADSDGYFCVGKDYLAYQFGLAAPPVTPHRLTIVRFDRAGLAKPAVVALPQFQVHGMVCLSNMIRVAAFDSIYTVRLDSAAKPTGVGPAEPRNRRSSEFGVPRNLGRLSRPVYSLKVERVQLGRTPNGHSFELEITPQKGKASCATDITTRLVERAPDGHPVQTPLVFSGRGYRECGE